MPEANSIPTASCPIGKYPDRAPGAAPKPKLLDRLREGLRSRHSFATHLREARTSKDDHLLELAIASGTKLIVTHNTKDFKGVEEFGIKSITPKTILEEIL